MRKSIEIEMTPIDKKIIDSWTVEKTIQQLQILQSYDLKHIVISEYEYMCKKVGSKLPAFAKARLDEICKLKKQG